MIVIKKSKNDKLYPVKRAIKKSHFLQGIVVYNLDKKEKEMKTNE